VWEHLGFGGDETLKDIEEAIGKRLAEVLGEK
jgi:hypothetical protein